MVNDEHYFERPRVVEQAMRSFEFIALMLIVYYLVVVCTVICLSLFSTSFNKVLERKANQHENEL